jgi:hypothetical protein
MPTGSLLGFFVGEGEMNFYHVFPLDSGDIYIYVSLSVSASLTAYAIHPQQLDGNKLILQQIFSTKWHCAPLRFVFQTYESVEVLLI